MPADPLSGTVLAIVALSLIAGMAVPFTYGMERLNGFGRWMADKLPYTPPPGKDEGEAMEAATDEQS